VSTEEEYSLLSNMPEATKVDEESDEFQNVVKNFYESIQQFHSKIRIIQASGNETEGRTDNDVFDVIRRGNLHIY